MWYLHVFVRLKIMVCVWCLINNQCDTAAGNTDELTHMDHMTTHIMFVSTGVLFYDCSNVLFGHVYFPVWRIGKSFTQAFQ
jgi:hypothetical protein